jgi:hypothetical protein
MYDVLQVVAMFIAFVLSLRAAVACHRARVVGLPGADALVWAALSAILLLLSLLKTWRGLGLLRGFGDFLRSVFKNLGWYQDRRTLQITASLAVLLFTLLLFAWGLVWAWNVLRRYRLAIGFTGLTIGFGLIRFISLHEVDAWSSNAAWVSSVIDLLTATGVSVLAVTRYIQVNGLLRPPV